MLIPIPGSPKANSSVYDLKERLDWGEPALTIIDVRSRDAFYASHITGAVPFPMSQLVEQAAANLELGRDIFVYGSSDRETTCCGCLAKGRWLSEHSGAPGRTDSLESGWFSDRRKLYRFCLINEFSQTFIVD